MIDLDDIRRAHVAISDNIVSTPCLHSLTLSELLGADVNLKFDNLQFTGSFKERGALNKLLSLSDAERQAGIIAVSAGNHAQGVAYHARRLGIQATIVMPATAPAVKVARVRAFGAEVVLHGQTFSDATEAVPDLVSRHGMVVVHPFDDPVVIAGQGTVAIEMIQALPGLDVLIVPIGGGGLISGMAIAAKALKPSIKIIGVQSELYPGMLNALGRRERGASGSSIAEGIAVESVGKLTAGIVAQFVDDIVTVSEARIEDAMAALLEIEKTLCEGAGAAGIAAIMEHSALFLGLKTGVVLSGGNVDMNVLSAVLNRTLVRSGRVVQIAVTTLDVSGSLASIASVIAGANGNIRNVTHDRVFNKRSAKTAVVVFEVELQDAAAQQRICDGIEKMGMQLEITS